MEQSNNVQEQIFWNFHRSALGFDISNPVISIKEKMYWASVRRNFDYCNAVTNARASIVRAESFHKAYYLQKWWNTLTELEKEELLVHAWLNKGSSLLFGFDFWINYF
ncbi:hypothetical protein [Viridibacillus arvi]|uniref:hypothetical protein n=1 Tax=Viridibacillus arvi TaxID=263475 RepID=UPI003D0666E2